MTIIINQQSRFFEEVPQHIGVLVDLETQGKTRGVAVALNNRVVPRDRWTDTTLTENDQILIITASQGG